MQQSDAAERSRLGRRSRTKGKAFERAIAAMLRPIFGEHVARGFQSRSGRDGCDVEGTRFWIETKHGKLVNLRAALRQAIEASDGRTPLVVAKDDRTDPVVVLRLADALPLLRARVALSELERVRGKQPTWDELYTAVSDALDAATVPEAGR